MIFKRRTNIIFIYFALGRLNSQVFGTSSKLSSQEVNPLNGQHLNVLAMEFPVTVITKRNATGHVISIDGAFSKVIATLSEMYHFSYSYLPAVARVFEDSSYARGAMSYLISGEADYLLSTTIGTAARFEKVDYPANLYNGPFYAIVPYPKENFDLAASLRPLSYTVWIVIVAAVFGILFCLRILSEAQFQKKISSIDDVNIFKNQHNMKRITQYVVGNLLSQGKSCFSQRLTVRVAAGVWVLGCFFLVQIYCSTLTSHLTSPNQKPIVLSLFAIASTPGVSLTVDRGFGLDTILQQFTTPGPAKRLGEMLMHDPSLRCNITSDCLERVKGGYAAYSAPITNLKTIMDADLKKTSICNYYLLKDGIFSSPVFTTLRKKSPYMEIMSRGILRMKDAGLIDKLVASFVPTPYKCMELNRRDSIRRLSTRHLSSAFIILLAGYILSIFIFAIENIVSCFGRKLSKY